MSLKYWAWFCTAVLTMALGAGAEAISSAVNISTRLAVQTGNNVGIAGFIIIGNGQKKVCIRALGPTMSSVQGVLADPKLEVYDKTGTLIASNDNWRTSQEDEIIAAGFAPNNDTESPCLWSKPSILPGDNPIGNQRAKLSFDPQPKWLCYALAVPEPAKVCSNDGKSAARPC